MKFLRLMLGFVLMMGLFVLVGCNETEETADVAVAEVSATVDATAVAATQEVIVEATAEAMIARQTEVVEMMTYLSDDDPFLGPEDAAVTIVEFSDFLCPYCGEFQVNTLPLILENYGDVVKYVHRDYLLMDDASLTALMGANCAGEQGLYWEMSDMMYAVYEDFDVDAMHGSGPPAEGEDAGDDGEKGGGPDQLHSMFSEDVIMGYAETLGLDMTQFTSCMDEGRTEDEIQADFEAAQKMGIWSIPVYVVNGYYVAGYREYEDWVPILDQALTEANYTAN